MISPSIAVLIPCHNEQAAIARVVTEFRAALPTATIYVYDNSAATVTMGGHDPWGPRLSSDRTGALRRANVEMPIRQRLHWPLTQSGSQKHTREGHSEKDTG